MSQSVSANLTLCQLHYVYLREDVVQIAYAPLEASTVVVREVCSFTPVRISTNGLTHYNTLRFT